ncbi:MAG: alpha-glucan family phosphorylase, partial [Sedimentisphaerales bacterium]|nr:alpha-glucan family phosphorylase [Sedimentisphaerales bacterium]
FKEVNHNPVRFLHALSKERLEILSADRGFLFELEKVWQQFDEYMRFDADGKESNGMDGFDKKQPIAYFSMEFGLHEAIPIYAGGLGVLAGDFLKGASDMGLPVVGVGILYRCGYFTQKINPNGYQEEVYSEFENHLIPIKEKHLENGDPAFVDVRIGDDTVMVKIWQIDVGKTQLLLLDTDIESNLPQHREITNELYTADRERRMLQELVLGIGGIKALALLGIEPKVYHLNEGHSAFLIVGRLRQLMFDKKLTLSEARAIIRASTLFTTHTPLIEGNENFPTELVKKYLEKEVKSLGLTFEDFAKIGFVGDNKDTFWLPAMAIRFADYINGVSQQHERVSKNMWAQLWPQRSKAEVPIGYVTNGVHRGWVSENYTKIFGRYVGPDYIHRGQKEEVWQTISNIPDEEIWQAHRRNKQDLINFIRRKLADDVTARGYSQAKILKLSRLFNPEYLTIVFARRFATYKRSTLILTDKERLKQILTSTTKPVQLIFAGKAHPADFNGKNLIKDVIEFSKDYGLEDRVIFLENYDMNVARHLCWGADVWINVPLRDMEASGTSGMKAAMNGVLQLSCLEGWWIEGYNGRNGWAVTAGQFYNRSDLQEMAEAGQVYDLLEEEITEFYYDRNEAGIPEQWVRMMKESIFTSCQKFNMNRVLDNYMKQYYIPSKKETDRLTADKYKALKESVSQESQVLKYWDAIKLSAFTTTIDKKLRLVEDDAVEARCSLNVDNAPPELFKVELFYTFSEKTDYKIVPMEFVGKEGGDAQYKCTFSLTGYGLQNINVRVKPADKTIENLHPEMLKWID